MNKLIKFIPVLLLAISSLSAEVHFDLRFSDPIGTGFNDPINESKKKAVIEGAELLGKCIKQNAFVTVKVAAGEGYGSSMPLVKRNESNKAKVTERAMNKILKEINEEFSGVWDGDITLDVGSLDMPSLKRITVHELTHTLGFSSFLTKKSPEISDNFAYSNFDELISDSKGRPLIIEDLGYLWNDFKYNPDFNFNSNVYACGPNIKKHDREGCVQLYNPTVFNPGSSISHVDTSYPKSLMNWVALESNYGLWNKYEIGIMEDLGYEIDWNNYCKFVENEINDFNLDVNMDGLKGINCYFVLKGEHPDFPKDCFMNETFYDSFISKVSGNIQLQLFVNEELIFEKQSTNFHPVIAERILNILGRNFIIKVALEENKTIKLNFSEIENDKSTCS